MQPRPRHIAPRPAGRPASEGLRVPRANPRPTPAKSGHFRPLPLAAVPRSLDPLPSARIPAKTGHFRPLTRGLRPRTLCAWLFALCAHTGKDRQKPANSPLQARPEPAISGHRGPLRPLRLRGSYPEPPPESAVPNRKSETANPPIRVIPGRVHPAPRTKPDIRPPAPRFVPRAPGPLPFALCAQDRPRAAAFRASRRLCYPKPSPRGLPPHPTPGFRPDAHK
jgi:hypothetical protein